MPKHLILLGWLLLPGTLLADDDQIFALIDARLELMQDVAAYKWSRELPIEDLPREAIVIDRAVNQGLNAGIRPETARAFFIAQIEAAKTIQAYWFQRYARNPPGDAAPDLNAVVRPHLLTLGDEITMALGHLQLTRADQSAFNNAVAVTGLTDTAKHDLFEALLRVRQFDSRLEQILETGILRVGTTGDYAPFSFANDGEAPTGIDIELARNLARALDVTLELVPTSWPTLSQDLVDGKYDIAMSGVSRTLARQRIGFLSPAYHVGGKTPIVRCEDAKRFTDFSRIDQPGVRVIVNPGGTNQAFADANIRLGDVRVFDDNRTIFDEIALGRADVMITDAIEVRLKTVEDPRLCAGMPGETLTYQEKAYLMPQDIALKEFVSTWLALRQANGTIDAIFSQFLGTDS